MPRIAWAGLILVLLAAVALVGVPIYLLWPFKPQGPSFVPWAWTLRREWAPMVTPLLARDPRRRALRRLETHALARQDRAVADGDPRRRRGVVRPPEPLRVDVQPDRGAAVRRRRQGAGVDPDDLVLGVVIKDDAVAFPVRRIGYHHVVNVTIGGEPIVASYCTLCHTGTIFKRTLNGLCSPSA